MRKVFIPVILLCLSISAFAGEPLAAGFRYSVFNVNVAPKPDYWARVAKEMAARFSGAQPEGIWIVSRVFDRGSQLSFPIESAQDPMIIGMEEDRNEAALTLFDQLGIRIWLQVEPGFASVDELFQHILKRYSQHPCVIGVGVDVEWYRSTNPDAGDPVSDENAAKWLAVARSFNPKYRLFLKHWLPEKMPPTVREGILFVDDSQIFQSLDEIVNEFAEWGKHFAPYPVAYQFGYKPDKIWWGKMKDAPKEIGSVIIQRIPNTEAVVWVDFSVLDVFPE